MPAGYSGPNNSPGSKRGRGKRQRGPQEPFPPYMPGGSVPTGDGAEQPPQAMGNSPVSNRTRAKSNAALSRKAATNAARTTAPALPGTVTTMTTTGASITTATGAFITATTGASITAATGAPITRSKSNAPRTAARSTSTNTTTSTAATPAQTPATAATSSTTPATASPSLKRSPTNSSSAAARRSPLAPARTLEPHAPVDHGQDTVPALTADVGKLRLASPKEQSVQPAAPSVPPATRPVRRAPPPTPLSLGPRVPAGPPSNTTPGLLSGTTRIPSDTSNRSGHSEGSTVLMSPTTATFPDDAFDRPGCFGSVTAVASSKPNTTTPYRNALEGSFCRSDIIARAEVFVFSDRNLGKFSAADRKVCLKSHTQLCIRQLRLQAGDLKKEDVEAEERGPEVKPSVLASAADIDGHKLEEPSTTQPSEPVAVSGIYNGIVKPDITIGGQSVDKKSQIVTLTAEHKTSKAGEGTISLIAPCIVQGVVQVLSAYEAFGTFLSYAMVNFSFSRMVLIPGGAELVPGTPMPLVAIEASKTTRGHFRKRIVNCDEFLGTNRHFLSDILANRFANPKEQAYEIDDKGAKRFWSHVSLAMRLVLAHDYRTCLALPRLPNVKTWLTLLQPDLWEIICELKPTVRDGLDEPSAASIRRDKSNGSRAGRGGFGGSAGRGGGKSSRGGSCGGGRSTTSGKHGDGGGSGSNGTQYTNLALTTADQPQHHPTLTSSAGADHAHLPDPHAPPPDCDLPFERELPPFVDYPDEDDESEECDDEEEMTLEEAAPRTFDKLGLHFLIVSPTEMDALVADMEKELAAELGAKATGSDAEELAVTESTSASQDKQTEHPPTQVTAAPDVLPKVTHEELARPVKPAGSTSTALPKMSTLGSALSIPISAAPMFSECSPMSPSL